MYRSLSWLDRDGLATHSAYPERTHSERNWLDGAASWTINHLLKPAARSLFDPVGNYRGIVAATHRHQTSLNAHSDGALRDHAATLRARLRRGTATEDALGECFALISEAARRTLGMMHYDEQLLGGYALLKGKLVEMATGEGKTLTASLPAATAGLMGMPVHVVTVNDYLAARDAEDLRPLYEYLGLSVGTIQEGMNPPERRLAYGCDITYCTNKQVVFDYLRDQVATSGTRSHLRRALGRIAGGADAVGTSVLRGLHFAIVDEADSVLVDEARTPLILSRFKQDPTGELERLAAFKVAAGLKPGEDFKILAKDRAVELSERGKNRLESLLTQHLTPATKRRNVRAAVPHALTAQWIFARDEHYVVREGKVEIVDEFTGRLLADRAWENGLHQMVEIKEACAQTPLRETEARITYQRFFRRYLLLAGMTGTALEVAAEMADVYHLDVVKMPLHRPSQRKTLPATLCHSRQHKWQVVATRAREIVRDERRPVLIGTRTIQDSEDLSRLLAAMDLPYALLNAVREAEEAEIVAQAGRVARVTVATNMAGRGTDIKLDPAYLERGGLHVILTEHHDARRIDRQLFGRCARQGDPGSCEAIVSLDDALLARNLPAIAGLMKRLLARSTWRHRWLLRLLARTAQRGAEKRDARIRRRTLADDLRLAKLLAFSGRSR